MSLVIGSVVVVAYVFLSAKLPPPDPRPPAEAERELLPFPTQWERP